MITESLISLDRFQYFLLHVFPCIKNIDGDICEIGVYRGGSLSYFAKHMPFKKIIGIDTFDGLPDPCEYDKVNNLNEFTGHKKGDFGDVDYNKLKEFFDEQFDNVTLLKGFFPSKNIINQIKDNVFCFVHVDVDLYQSVLDCCKYFYPRLPSRGIMIFDDYGFDSTPGCKKAVDEFFYDKTNCIKRALPTKQYFVLKHKI